MPNVTCKICEKKFYTKPFHFNKGWGKYCSKQCQNEGQKTGQFVKCKICSTKVWRMQRSIEHSTSKNFFCGKSCQAIWRNQTYMSEKHSGWINGIRTYRNIIRRSGVIEVCTKCGYKNTKVLIVHHIDHNRSNNSLNNLMWLCRNCHYLIHEGKTF